MLIPGKSCGCIGCVGISAKRREAGAGSGLVASAMMEMQRRGADGCFIDWVSMKGFYERFGVKQWEAGYWTSTQ